jgi:hypothetical protein
VNRRRATIVLAGTVTVLVVLAALAQLVLPGIAASRLRSRLARNGNVLSVSVSAFPAVKLLFGHADGVKVRMGTVHIGVGEATGLLSMSVNAGALDMAAQQVQIGPLALAGATVHKGAGGELTGGALLSDAAIAAALPAGLAVTPIASGDGQLLLRGQLSAFGFSVGADAVLEALDGRLVIVPVGAIGALLSLTVYSDPRIHVDSVGAAPAPGGFQLSASAHVTG